eukprot:6188461-Pleurochrysis_carterae.AAC.2
MHPMRTCSGSILRSGQGVGPACSEMGCRGKRRSGTTQVSGTIGRTMRCTFCTGAHGTAGMIENFLVLPC